MRIFQIFPNYGGIGGITTVIKNLSSFLVSSGYDVTVLTERDDITNDETGINVTTFPKRPFSLPTLKFITFVRDIKGSLVHIHGFHNLWSFFVLLILNKNNRIVLNMHYIGHSSNALRNFILPFYRFFFNMQLGKVDCIVCVSKFERQLVLEDFSVKPDKVSVIPNGFDIKTLSAYKWSYHPENNKVLFVGRLAEIKNVNLLIEAIAQLPSLNLTIMGKGPLEQQLRQIVKERGLGDRVVFKFSLNYEEILHEYATARVLILPSSYESFGIVVGEASLVGCPVLVTNISALSEFIDHNIANGIEPPITEEKISKSLLVDYKDSPRDKAMSFYIDWSQVCQQYDNLYQGVIRIGK